MHCPPYSWLQLLCLWIVWMLACGVSCTQYTNAALDKPAAQDTTDHGGGARKAVDGNKNTKYYEGYSCTHTVPGPNSWWAVDLLASYDVHSIAITNRLQFSFRLKNFRVYVSDEFPLPIPSDNGGFSGEMCFSYPGTFPSAATLTHDCSRTLHGRYVYVFKPDTEPLTLCEVEVMATRSGTIRERETLFVQSPGRKSLLPSFYSSNMTVPSKLKCVSMCLSRTEGVATTVQYEEFTWRCDCIQKSRLTNPSPNWTLDTGWSLMELPNN